MTDAETETVRCRSLIVGAGAAGARAAIAMSRSGLEPLVVSKRDHGDAHTTWARGGINAALGNVDGDDSCEVHAADTLDEGHFVNDPEAVEVVTSEAPDRIRELDDWGMDFSRTKDGEINQRYFGAQAYPRTCFAGDHTGESMLDALVGKAQEIGIPYRDNVMITRLLSDGGKVYGAVGYDMEDGGFVRFLAGAVVLAAGGATAVYSRHSSREEENNGDGAALAYEAGAELMDMEFVQFHPTGMVGERYGEDWDGRLVTEAVRGDGGVLRNSEGERFMFEYSEMDRPELDARDVVARGIANEIDEGRGTENGGVYLDISDEDRDYIRERLPRMYERFESLGVDIAEEPMEVAPTAHYAMGGVDFDPRTGETGVESLYVVGETTAGVHGANRLGGNSLAETVTVGKLVGEYVASQEPIAPDEEPDLGHGSEEEFERLRTKLDTDGSVRVDGVVEELGELMEDHAGIRRDSDGLREGLERLDGIRKKTDSLGIDGGITSVEFEFAVDLEFMVTVAEGILRGALERTESRGAHYRDDHTERSRDWRKNILYRETDDGMSLRTSEPGEPNEGVKRALDEEHELEYHHLE
ncbi:FAD-binding protein [Haladaptatus sp. F3-133]|jgi:succinate dehydrogenase / fumarate reductase flavoprotein subunit|uniref:FAD-binding protein n=1 Tax=Halorutilus salinus TaxID=2487751 RepID=A0A9Q4C2T4_9EURY|nr:FAD-binding protein [Halorutilus salinus]MCX2817915.1 FAD-binding protein [Halorutilus salinus]